jgi:hypothetical protein
VAGVGEVIPMVRLQIYCYISLIVAHDFDGSISLIVVLDFDTFTHILPILRTDDRNEYSISGNHRKCIGSVRARRPGW